MRLSLLLILLPFASLPAQEPISFPHVHEVKVSDPMWTPLMDRAKSITVPDVLDKFEGKRHTTQEGGDEAAENTPEQPLRISPRTTKQSVSEPLLLRPHSYTVVRIDK